MKTKMFKAKAIALALSFTLSVAGCGSKTNGNNQDNIGDAAPTKESVISSSGDSDCINEKNYAEVLTFEEAIKHLYAVNNINQDPQKYKSFKESIEGRYDIIQDWWFLSIDNYRSFLSDNAACNMGKESLKSFICSVKSDKSFLKRRFFLDEPNTVNLDDLPSFLFYFKITPVYIGNTICGDETVICSWEEVKENEASYVITSGNDIWERYTFARRDGLWYLTEFFTRSGSEWD